MIPDSTYFFSASILDSIPILINETFKRIVIRCLIHLVQQKKVEVYGYVIMPAHLHLLWRVNQKTVEEIEGGFLRFTAQQMKFVLLESSPAYLKRFEEPAESGRFKFWNISAPAEKLNRADDLAAKLDFMHSAPLQDGWKLARLPEEYPFSSAAFYIRAIDPFHILTDYREEVNEL